MKKYTSFRWILLATGLLAIIGLTGMNVYYLYRLHQSAIQSNKENKRHQLDELTAKVKNRFIEVPRGIWKLNSINLEDALVSHEPIPREFNNYLKKISKDSLYSGIYFEFSHLSPSQSPLRFAFSVKEDRLHPIAKFPQIVNDGIGLAKTRMKVFVNDYQFPTKTLFDTNRSMTVTIFNTNDHSIIGYLCLPINNDYLIHDYLQPLLMKTFDPNTQKGLTVWVHNWVKNEVLATSNPKVAFDHKNVQLTVDFRGMFDNWNLKASYSNTPVLESSSTQFFKNLAVLSVGVLLLLGSMVFIFVTAQKERDLAERQAGFLANVTHELKTPISVMMAAGENLSDGRVRDPDRIKSYGTHIYEEAIRLRKMIDKLLDVARADADQLSVKPAIVHLDQLLRNYLDQHYQYLTSAGFTVDVDIESKLPPVNLDASSFETIIGNLIENAVKYSTDDKYLGLRLYQNDKELMLDVEDHGIGIPPNAQKHIFDKFFRVENALTAETKGHGLGLSIVQYLVEHNGGQINLTSQHNKGSIFTLHFPIIEQIDESSVIADGQSPVKSETSQSYVIQE